MTIQDTTTAPHKGRDYWRNHVNTWEASGGTQSNYCREHQLSERLFSLWKNKFIKEQSPDPEPEVNFVPVIATHNTTSANNDSRVTITLPNGIRLDVMSTSSGATIAELAKHLVALSC